jgi:hypothetical protein
MTGKKRVHAKGAKKREVFRSCFASFAFLFFCLRQQATWRNPPIREILRLRT